MHDVVDSSSDQAHRDLKEPTVRFPCMRLAVNGNSVRQKAAGMILIIIIGCHGPGNLDRKCLDWCIAESREGNALEVVREKSQEREHGRNRRVVACAGTLALTAQSYSAYSGRHVFS